jgi:hypothetical membrane protein
MPAAALATPARPITVATSSSTAVCGLVAGPLFVIIGLIEAFTIPGFDLTRHYLSLLSAGPLGWIQMANFVVSGLLTVAFAAGLRRELAGHGIARAGAVLIGVYGVCFAAAGIFVADPALGFPPGTPDGIPATFSWHGITHGVAAILSFLALAIAGIVFAIRFARSKQWGWVAFSVATAAIVFALPSIPNPWGGVFLFVASAVGWAWLFALALWLKQRMAFDDSRN